MHRSISGLFAVFAAVVRMGANVAASETMNIVCAAEAKASVAIQDRQFVLSAADSHAQQEPVPEPVVSSAFDADHTIICYGDSLTWGVAATNVTVDGRANFFDGRFAGLTNDVTQSYPYVLSGIIPSSYNVISACRGGAPAHLMMAWSGDSVVEVKRDFTLPAAGSISVSTNFVFRDCPWGEWGRWAGTGSSEEERIDTFNRWAGFVTPYYPPTEPYDMLATCDSITGTLAGRHVRLQGIHPTNITITVFGTGAEQTVPAGSVFVPDMLVQSPYKDAVRIVCGAANDTPGTIDDYTVYVKPYFDKFASRGGKYMVVSQTCWTEDWAQGERLTQNKATLIEQNMAASYGEHYLNLRMAFVTNGMATAKKMGVVSASSSQTWVKALLDPDMTHLTSAGYAVMAEFVRRKLVALGYIEGGTPESDRPPVVSPESIFDGHPEWGYKVEGLGAARDEMALVFTNQSATASWTLPADLGNIQFLVVGGGGGGGADLYSDDVRQGGAGGGGGGVVTGIVAQVAKDAVLSVTVGAGGVGGVVGTKRSNNYGAAANGANSSLSVGGVPYVTAFGGGGDKGSASLTAVGNAGGAGGSSAGSRPGNGTQTGAADTSSCINASALSNIPAHGVLGTRGGAGTTMVFYGYYFAAGGGGGATEAGGDGTLYDGSDTASAFWAGKGGEGLASDIAGTEIVYGSGGGGGSVWGGSVGRGGFGGTGAGNGNVDSATGSGSDALSNQGGGGGGGGRAANGGNGGSGIVVLRFRIGGEAPADANPTVDGVSVAPADVFTLARTTNSIVYPLPVALAGAEGSQVISYNGVDLAVPDYYTATLAGNVITLVLNGNAKPVIASAAATSGIAVADGKVRIHLANVKPTLYYAILTATSLDAVEWTPCGGYALGAADFEYDASSATRFYKAAARDVP